MAGGSRRLSSNEAHVFVSRFSGRGLRAADTEGGASRFRQLPSLAGWTRYQQAPLCILAITGPEPHGRPAETCTTPGL